MSSQKNGKIDALVTNAAEKLNYFAAVMLGLMMMVTCIDVLLRGIRLPVPGGYELVGFLGALTVAFALAGTSLGKGHIAVEYLVNKFPARLRKFVERANCLVSSIIFSVITWQTFLHAMDLRESGEVSMTLQLPLYPFSLGLALGCGLVALVMFFQALNLVHYGISGE